MSTDPHSCPPLPPGVVIRPATPRDHAGVAKLSRGVFGGLDYIPDRYPFYMTSAEHFCYLLEKAGQIVCFTYRYVVDDGDTVLLAGGRTHPDYQGRGYLSMLRGRADADLAKRLRKKPSHWLYLAQHSALHRDRWQNHPEVYKLINTMNLFSRSAKKHEISALVTSEPFRAREARFTTELWSPSMQEMAALLSDGATRGRLFPCGYFSAFWEPYSPRLSNVALARKLSKVFVNGDRRSGEIRGLSWVTTAKCEAGLRYDLEFFGTAAVDFIQHFHKYAKNLLDLDLPEKQHVEIHLLLPSHIDKTLVDRFLDDYQLQLSKLEDNAPVIMMETCKYQHKL